jgi:ABC-type glycerol-3-phosphate transport system permease component
LIIDHSQRLTTGRWEQAVNRALELPVRVLYIIFNRQIVAGMTSGAVEG